MSLLHYIDNEVPSFGQWDQVVFESSTIVESAAAAFPDRGSTGLRLTTAGDAAYVRKNTSYSLAAGGTFYIGCWVRPNTYHSSSIVTLAMTRNGANMGVILNLNSDNRLLLWAYSDGGGLSQGYSTAKLFDDKWYYVVVKITRATTDVAADGAAAVYVDGLKEQDLTAIDNYDRVDEISTVDVGSALFATTGAEIDFDEVKIATTYPEPYAPTPADEYMSAERTCVLYRRNNNGSIDFAEYVRAQLGIPACNFIPVTVPASPGYLDSYSAYESHVLDRLDEVFANHPTALSNCMCFALAHEAPYTFVESGVTYSVPNWLCNYGGDSTPQLANPLYSPSTVARLTKTSLAGKYLACTLGADSYGDAQAYITRAATIQALPALPDADTLYSDDATYRASLGCQHLRILTGRMGPLSDDAFVFGDVDAGYDATGTLSPDATGTYVPDGDYGGKPSYARQDEAYYLWWYDGGMWVVTETKGTLSDNYWWRGEPNPPGSYTAHGEMFGLLTMFPSALYGSAGTRAVFCDTSADSAATLDDPGPPPVDETLYGAFQAGYAAGLGCSGPADTFDIESFFEMLRIGGTFVEAAMVATANLKYTAVPAGSPLLTVAVQTKGRTVYHGLGGPEAIDWLSPIAYVRHDSQTHTTHVDLAAGQEHVLAARAVSSAGVTEQNSHVLTFIELDAQGSLLPTPLAQAHELTADVLEDQSVLLGFSYRGKAGSDSPTGFEVYSDSGSGVLDLQNPAATVTCSAGQSDFEAVLSPPSLPAMFAVRAVRGQQAGPLSRVITARAQPAPTVPTLIED